ncbi:hypothetical protein R3W88_023375 [Solanum pinnatisectum]|uniref:Protein kinase domain-containing protein n=1 Tax=Solanum pinnatisectum TaxID=50273 RepID=A0AAV9LXB6_9SOLN|nr:hypothetical protein R3W88_023375 [Solanum pinnatisectum]
MASKTKNYFAMKYVRGGELFNKSGYDGEKVDIWSCGMILFVLLACYLPFHDTNLMEMYKKISKGVFKYPEYFP